MRISRMLVTVFAFFVLTMFSRINVANAFEWDFSRGAPTAIEWQPSGHVLLVTSSTGIWLYDADGFQDIGHLPDIQLAKFSPDGGTIAAINMNNDVVLWEYPMEGRVSSVSQLYSQTRLFRGFEYQPYHPLAVYMAWSYDSNYLATTNYDGQVFVHSIVQRFTQVLPVIQATEPMWSPQENFLALEVWGESQWNNRLEIWDIEHNQVVFTSPISPNIGRFWSSDGRFAMHSHLETIMRFWHPDVGEHTQTIPGEFRLSLHFNPSTTSAVAQVIGHEVRVYATGKTDQLVYEASVGEYIWNIARWRPDGQQVALGMFMGEVSNRIEVYDIERGFVMGWYPHNGDVMDMQWNSDGHLLATVGQRGDIRIWNVRDGELIAMTTRHSDYCIYNCEG